MKAKTIDEYLTERWDREYQYQRRRSKVNKRNFHILRVVEICAAAFIPYGNSLAEETHAVEHLVTMSGVVITLIAGLLLLFRFQENWIEARWSVEQMKSERVMFEMRSGVYKDANDVEDKFVERIERIIGTSNKEWKKEHDQHDDNKPG